MKTDLKKELAAYRAKRGTFEIVYVPPQRYLMIDGHGDPNGPAYAEAIATLFPVAYKLKFLSKAEADRDYVVMPLEALWWSADMDSFTTARDKSQWDWTAMILTPDWITDDQFTRAVAAAAGAPRLDALRLETLTEGLCVQTLHLGSFDDEGPVLEAMHHSFLPDHALVRTGKHHEIYFSDVRRTAPEKLRTILRQPVGRAEPGAPGAPPTAT